MKLIVETDLGHDPDDFFALCYLIAAGVEIKAILVHPGDPDQLAVARFLCIECGLDIPIGAAKAGRTKKSSGSIHHAILEHYGYDTWTTPDDLSHEILENVVPANLDAELFVIGPVSSIGKYIAKHPTVSFPRATMQGGFVPYSLYRPAVVHPDFDTQQEVEREFANKGCQLLAQYQGNQTSMKYRCKCGEIAQTVCLAFDSPIQ